MTQDDTGRNALEHDVPALGAALRAARVDRGMSVQDVATALHLDARTIEALETEEWDALPPGPFTRGYVRAYAKLLELDDLVERHLGGVVREQSAPLKIKAPMETAPQMPRLVARTGVALVAVGLVAAGGWWFLDRTAPFLSSEPPPELTQSDDEIPGPDGEVPALEDDVDPDALPEEDVAEAPDAPVGDDSEVLGDDDEVELADEAPADLPDPDSAPGEALDGPDPDVALGDDAGDFGDDPLLPDDQPGDPVEQELADGGVITPEGMDTGEEVPAPEMDPGDDGFDVAEDVAPDDEGTMEEVPDDEVPEDDADIALETPAEDDDAAPLDDPDQLVLEFSGPSWMEVTDARGERILYGLVQEEGEQTLEGEAPFSVVIGDVTQVNVYYQDSEVDLGPDDAGRVVRVEVP